MVLWFEVEYTQSCLIHPQGLPKVSLNLRQLQ